MHEMQADVKSRANYVYYYFENSSTRRTNYKEVRKEEKLSPHDKNNDLVRPVFRFLYFKLVCQGLLEQEYGLIKYF